jgi:hypothetical protein
MPALGIGKIAGFEFFLFTQPVAIRCGGVAGVEA